MKLAHRSVLKQMEILIWDNFVPRCIMEKWRNALIFTNNLIQQQVRQVTKGYTLHEEIFDNKKFHTILFSWWIS